MDKNEIFNNLDNLRNNFDAFKEYIDYTISNSKLDINLEKNIRYIFLQYFLFRSFDKKIYENIIDSIINNNHTNCIEMIFYKLSLEKSDIKYIDKDLFNYLIKKHYIYIDQYLLLLQYISIDNLLEIDIVKKIDKKNLTKYIEVLLNNSVPVNIDIYEKYISKIFEIDNKIFEYLDVRRFDENINIDIMYKIVEKSLPKSIFNNRPMILYLFNVGNSKLKSLIKEKVKNCYPKNDKEKYDMIKLIKQINDISREHI